LFNFENYEADNKRGAAEVEYSPLALNQ